MSGEESEILLLLRLMGWSLYYEPQLKIQHFMTSNRLNWRYYLRLRRSLGATSVYLELYKAMIHTIVNGGRPTHKSWRKELSATIKEILKDPPALFAGLLNTHQGNYRITRINFQIGRFNEQLKLGKKIDEIYSNLFEKYVSIQNTCKLSKRDMEN